MGETVWRNITLADDHSIEISPPTLSHNNLMAIAQACGQIAELVKAVPNLGSCQSIPIECLENITCAAETVAAQGVNTDDHWFD